MPGPTNLTCTIVSPVQTTDAAPRFALECKWHSPGSHLPEPSTFTLDLSDEQLEMLRSSRLWDQLTDGSRPLLLTSRFDSLQENVNHLIAQLTEERLEAEAIKTAHGAGLEQLVECIAAQQDVKLAQHQTIALGREIQKKFHGFHVDETWFKELCERIRAKNPGLDVRLSSNPPEGYPRVRGPAVYLIASLKDTVAVYVFGPYGSSAVERLVRP